MAGVRSTRPKPLSPCERVRRRAPWIGVGLATDGTGPSVAHGTFTGEKRMRMLKGLMAVALVASVAGTRTANAQAFNFFTMGQFVSAAPSCNNAAPAMVVSCADPGSSLTLTYTGNNVVPGDYASPTTVQFGQFDPAGVGEITIPASTVLFRLFVDQSVPTMSSGYFEGFLTGYARQGTAGSAGNPCPGTAQNCSQVVWTPTTTELTLDNVQYSLVLNPGNVFKVAAVVPSTVKADVLVTATPEPATVGLMATGLLGVFGYARRRRAA